jgi:pseudouridine-5'-phosphate glycosidase
MQPALSDFLAFAPEVKGALAAGGPVVALESTIVTHGMPWPQNLEAARRVEAIVRKGGAIPATVATIGGRLRIGLDESTLEKLARAKNVMKLSRADLAFALATGRTGSTTVAATMMAAALAGIEAFATGGIGGVHKNAIGGGEASFDISADIPELGRSNVIVVSAGAKAILDLPKTLEALETAGVPVIGYRSDAFPAFWSADSGLKAPLRLDSPAEIATLWRTRKALGQTGGMLVANPIPAEHEIPRPEMSRHVEAALAAAEEEQVAAKAVTPFLLSRIFELTGGRSLAANIALVENNARLAAEIAVKLAG